MLSINIDDEIKDITQSIISERYSRIPVYKDSIDNIIGILHTRDYLEILAEGKTPCISELIQQPFFVYKTRKLSALLADFKRKQVHIAIVADEYGGMLGIATMEDLLEELVGEIWDEDEVIEQQCRKINDTSYEISGDMPLEDVLELFEIPEKDVESASKSAGGWVFENMGIIPENDQTVELYGLKITVKDVSDNRINKLIISKSG